MTSRLTQVRSTQTYTHMFSQIPTDTHTCANFFTPFSLCLHIATSCLFYPVDKKMPAIRLSTRRKSELVGQVRKEQSFYVPYLFSLPSSPLLLSPPLQLFQIPLFFDSFSTHAFQWQLIYISIAQSLPLSFALISK